MAALKSPIIVSQYESDNESTPIKQLNNQDSNKSNKSDISTPLQSSTYLPKNRKFSYLFNQPNINTNMTPDNIKNNKNGFKNRTSKLSIESPLGPNKRGHGHRRKSSVQVDVLSSNLSKRIDALNKELLFLKKDIPQFSEIYTGSEIQFKQSKGNKLETMQFTMIQALSSWITTFGKPAYMEYNEFKDAAENEMISLVEQLEKSNLEIRKNKLIIDSLTSENEEYKEKNDDYVTKIFKLEADMKIYKEKNETNEINSVEISQLSQDYKKISEQRDDLLDSNKRLKSYLQASQLSNDELNNKLYKLEDDISKLQKENANLIKQLRLKEMEHEQELQNLKLSYKEYELRMQAEQEKLMKQVEENENLNDNFAKGMYVDANDDDIGKSQFVGDDNIDGNDEATVINSLANEFEEYEYEDEDAWLQESQEEEYDYQSENEWGAEQISYENEEETMEFEMEKQSHGQEQKNTKFETEKISFDLVTSSNTNLVATPISASPKAKDLEFETEKIGMEKIEEKEIEINKQDEFKTQKIRMKQNNELVKKKEKPIFKNTKPPKQFDKPKSKKQWKGLNGFGDILNKWKQDEKEKGGKPQVWNAKAYIIKNRWVTSEADLKKKENAVKNRKTVKASDPKLDNYKNTGKLNMHRKMTIIKKSKRYLKPRMMGYLQIIKSKYVKDYQSHSWQKEPPKFFFVLDALPSRTNTNSKEPDFVKQKIGDDFLVPALFFFTNKKVWDVFYGQNKDTPVRDLSFQKSFSSTAKGIFPLHNYMFGTTQKQALFELAQIKNKKKITLPRDQQDNSSTDRVFFICSQWESHKIRTQNEKSREAWIDKIKKIMNKRSNIARKGTGNVFDTQTQENNDESLKIVQPTEQAQRKMSVIKDIEDTFD